MDTQFSNLRKEVKTSVIIIQAGMGLENYIKIFIVIKNASHLTVSYFKAQHSAPYVANGLINV